MLKPSISEKIQARVTGETRSVLCVRIPTNDYIIFQSDTPPRCLAFCYIRVLHL